MAFHARGIEHQIQGVENALSIINLVLATGPDRRARQGLRDDHGTGERPGRARARAEDRPAPGPARHRGPGGPRVHLPVLGDRRGRSPAHGRERRRARAPDGEGEVRGLLGICNNPLVSMPNATRIADCYEALEFHVQLDFFLSETAARADVVLPSAVWAEDAGVTTNAEGKVVLRHIAAEPPGEAKRDWWIVDQIAERLGVGEKFAVRLDRGDLRGAPVGHGGRQRGLPGHHVRAPRTTRVPSRGRARPRITPGRLGCSRSGSRGRTVGRASTRSSGSSRTSPWTRSSRSGSRRAGPSRTSCRGTRRGGSRPSSNRRRGRGSRSIRRQGSRTATRSAWSRDEARSRIQRSSPRRSDRTPCSFLTTGQVRASANLLTVDALHPISKIPEYKVCACRIERGDAVTPAPPPPLAPGQAEDAVAARATADDRPPSAMQGRGTGEG